MDRKRILILILILIFFSMACELIDAAYDREILVDKEGKPIDRFAEENQAPVNGENQPEDKEQAEEKKEPFSFEKEYGDKYKAIDEAFDMLLLERADEERKKIVFREETRGDNIFPKSSIVPEGNNPAGDIIASGHFTLNIPLDGPAPPLEVRIPCGLTGDARIAVLCMGDAIAYESSITHAFFMAMDAFIAGEDKYFESYSFVFDSDLDPENNFVPLPEFDYDYFQDTDLWYTWMYTPGAGWNFMATRADGTPVVSKARAFIYNNLFIALIPEDELGKDGFSYRGTAEVHDGTYQPDFYSGNVTGENPTNAPYLFHNSPELHGYQQDWITHWIRGGYELCGWVGCEVEFPPGESWEEFTQIRCGCTTCGTRGDDQDCWCELFAVLKPGWSGDYELPHTYFWDHAADDGEWFERDPRYLYACSCSTNKSSE